MLGMERGVPTVTTPHGTTGYLIDAEVQSKPLNQTPKLNPLNQPQNKTPKPTPKLNLQPPMGPLDI